ncbi:MAG: TIGR04283 family arsenosugar biosynthesis glycosyltransferase [Burkholderiaceae bacterium]|jgi:rSAM/selenodomain-associated transferase 2|nr:TIGR04283 family arsenosugar biosynthesis glycosyltransferase [Burkholderiaceae bacterium]
MRLAIIVPVLNESSTIETALSRLAPLRARGARVIVVDGGSHDGTLVRAAAHADRVIAAARGRALQMNAGARDELAQDVDVLLFLHADTVLPPEADVAIFRAVSNIPRCWGRFDVRIEGSHPWLPWIARLMNWRSRASGICTGDQAIFVSRGAFSALEGFAAIPLMEDIEFSRRAGSISPPIALTERVTTSGRRWERNGVWRTVWLMWRLRLAYFFGADPRELARRYRDVR